MSDKIIKGPSLTTDVPNRALGIILYEELKKKDPQKTALIDGTTGEEVSFEKFLTTALKLAQALVNLKINKGHVISFVAENHWKYLAAITSGLFVGATINLLNPNSNSDDLKYFFSNCRPDLLFCTKKTLGEIFKQQNEPFFPSKIIGFDTNDSVKNFDNLLNETTNFENFYPVEADPENDVAFILVSSGTTGLPKFVQITHFNFRTQLLYYGPYLNFNPNESTIIYMPFCHILGCAITFTSLYYSTKIVILEKFDPVVFVKAIENYKITKLWAVPTIISFLAKTPLLDNCNISFLKNIYNVGGNLTRNLEEIIVERFNLHVQAHYGLTEISGSATVPQNAKKFGTIGKVFPTYLLKICHPETNNVLGALQVGELRFKGDGIMKGYLHNPSATTESFDEEGFLKTGDLGYYDEEEFVYIVDRIKNIIKYKGYQVSPAELENVLAEHSSVKEAVVIGVPDERSGEVALAIVVKKEEKQDVTEDDIVKHIAEKVSVHKRLYGGVRFVKEIPKTSSGKVWRRKLQDLL